MAGGPYTQTSLPSYPHSYTGPAGAVHPPKLTTYSTYLHMCGDEKPIDIFLTLSDRAWRHIIPDGSLFSFFSSHPNDGVLTHPYVVPRPSSLPPSTRSDPIRSDPIRSDPIRSDSVQSGGKHKVERACGCHVSLGLVCVASPPASPPPPLPPSNRSISQSSLCAYVPCFPPPPERQQ